MSDSSTTPLTFDSIKKAIEDLPIQHRTMMRLLLLQYLDPTQEEIDYMAADQPDSRFLSGDQPKGKILSREASQNIEERSQQYRLLMRQRRERPALQVDCLRQLSELTDAALRVVERLLKTKFQVNEPTLAEKQAQAPSTLVTKAHRSLDRALEKQEITETDYQKERLLLTFQMLHRKKDRNRRRLHTAQREFYHAGISPLQDHEIAHIWGIPLGSLAARKVKALHQYLLNLERLTRSGTSSSLPVSSSSTASAERPDYWKATFATLWKTPVTRSVVAYDGLERTEEALMEKLRAFATDGMSEDQEAKFWTTITKIHDSEHSGMWRSHSRAIFALQRLSAILKDLDQSEEALEETLLEKTTPASVHAGKVDRPETKEPESQLSEEALGILQAFAGEIDDKRTR